METSANRPLRTGKQRDDRIDAYAKVFLQKTGQISDEKKARMLNKGITPCTANKEHPKRLTNHQAPTTFETTALNWYKIKAEGTWSKFNTGDVL